MKNGEVKAFNTEGTGDMYDVAHTEEARLEAEGKLKRTVNFDAGALFIRKPVKTSEELVAEEVARLTENLYDEERAKRELIPPPFLIDDFLPDQSVGTLAGHAGEGKSTFAVHLARCINRQHPICEAKDAQGETIPYGIPNASGSAVYIAGEDPASISARIRAWDLYHDPKGNYADSPHKTYILKATPKLRTEEGYLSLKQVVMNLPNKPKIIVWDTLASCLSEMDSRSAEPENNNTDTTKLYQRCQRLASETGILSLFLHHPNKAGEDVRGAYAIVASSRFVWVLKSEGDLKVIRVTKANDFPKDAVTFTLKLEAVQIGVTVTPEGREKPQVSPVMSGGRSLSIKADASVTLTALECLIEEAEADGITPRKDWIARMKERGVKGERTLMKRLIQKGRVIGVGKPNERGSYQGYKPSDQAKADVAYHKAKKDSGADPKQPELKVGEIEELAEV